MHRLLVGFPRRHLGLALLLRGAVVWALVRGAVVMFGTWAGTDLVRLNLRAALAVVIVTGAMGRVQARLRNEHRYFPNLGTSPAALAVLSMAPAVLGECVLAVTSSVP
jgi:hypothetical protein